MAALKAVEHPLSETRRICENFDELEATVVGPVDQIIQAWVQSRLATDELDAAATEFGSLVDDSCPIVVGHVAEEFALRPRIGIAVRAEQIAFGRDFEPEEM